MIDSVNGKDGANARIDVKRKHGQGPAHGDRFRDTGEEDERLGTRRGVSLKFETKIESATVGTDPCRNADEKRYKNRGHPRQHAHQMAASGNEE